MTIQEIEQRSGLERANIRFYEREGLLIPQRRENGYRDYSDGDLELLLKIRLLRRLGFSLEVIRSLKEGDKALEDALARRLEALGGQRQALDATEQVCWEMRRDGASFPTLDAQHYLDAYDQALRAPYGATLRSTVPESDRIPPVRCPWRRYFARTMDAGLISILRVAVMALLLRINLLHINSVVDWLLNTLDWLLLIPVEGLLLSRWGTTPGKWLLGIRLERDEGGRLTFGEAACRSWRAFGRGLGYGIPFYNLYRLWRSYKAAMEDEGAEWDKDVALLVQEENCPWWRGAAYIAAYAVSIGLGILCILQSTMPVNRAPLTTEDFLENYNRLAEFYDFDHRLREDGMVLVPNSVYDGYQTPDPAYVPGESEERLLLKETDGLITEVSFQRQVSSFWYGFHFNTDVRSTATLAFMSLVWPEEHILTVQGGPYKEAIEAIETDGPVSFSRELSGWQVDYTVEAVDEGLAESGGWTERHYDVTFSIRRTEE